MKNQPQQRGGGKGRSRTRFSRSLRGKLRRAIWLEMKWGEPYTSFRIIDNEQPGPIGSPFKSDSVSNLQEA